MQKCKLQQCCWTQCSVSCRAELCKDQVTKCKAVPLSRNKLTWTLKTEKVFQRTRLNVVKYKLEEDLTFADLPGPGDLCSPPLPLPLVRSLITGLLSISLHIRPYSARHIILFALQCQRKLAVNREKHLEGEGGLQQILVCATVYSNMTEKRYGDQSSNGQMV